MSIPLLTPEQIARLSPQEFAEYEAIVNHEREVFDQSWLYRLYPDEGPLRRELYPKHLAHFAAGDHHQERAIFGGNRSGKTLCCSYETVLHMTGYYPNWWVGRRWKRQVNVWVAGEDMKAVRESLQVKFLGEPGRYGTGLIPGNLLSNVVPRSGVPDSVDTITVKHACGGISRLLFKSYDQKRESFQASQIDIMQFDEEPPQPIYSEGATRTMSTNPKARSGLVYAAFTPLKGLSAVVLSFMPNGQRMEGEVAA